MFDKYFLCKKKKKKGFGAGMRDNPPTGTGIPRNLLNEDGFGDGEGDGERG